MGLPSFLSLPLLALRKELKQAEASARERNALPDNLSLQEQGWLEQIREKTKSRNTDNVERTRAYLEYYQKHPEIHWALLAHLVSRNAGWSMTDLRGEFLPRLLSPKEQGDFFSFLERGNWLIFQDAYPQLLLYEESVRQKTNLFHLLPQLQVSLFMQAIWNHFWKVGNRELLAIGLIINEQNHLEEQVMKNPVYQKTVIQTSEFMLQELLHLNHILFPCQQKTASPKLIGHTVSQFASLRERISLGKTLYASLFPDSGPIPEVLEWATRHVHTGSRKDFWPHLFHDVNESVPGQSYRKKLEHCQLKPGSVRLYSPTLRHAWERIHHVPPIQKDWYQDMGVLKELRPYPKDRQQSQDIGAAYCRTLEKLEVAVIASGKIFRIF